MRATTSGCDGPTNCTKLGISESDACGHCTLRVRSAICSWLSLAAIPCSAATKQSSPSDAVTLPDSPGPSVRK